MSMPNIENPLRKIVRQCNFLGLSFNRLGARLASTANTYNPNMPLRGFFYLSQLYQMYIAKTNKNILVTRLIKLTEPCFVVFYNGSRKTPETFKLRLSDAFERRESDADEKSDGKASSGWETMLSAIINAGFSISGTWPMRTEMANRAVASGTNALASSVILVFIGPFLNPDWKKPGLLNPWNDVGV